MVDDVTFSVQRGQMFAIIGPNGAGKSTLLRAIVGLTPRQPSQRSDALRSGQSNSPTHVTQVYVNGTKHDQANHAWNHRIAFVSQRTDINVYMPITVKEAVAIGLYPELTWWQRLREDHHRRMHDVMTLLDLLDLADRRITDLSGGQQQKVFLAQALVQQPLLMLLDEPFEGVDSPSCARILSSLQTYCDQGGTVVCVHHNLETVRNSFAHGLLINRNVVAMGSVDHILEYQNLHRAYGLPVSTAP